MAFLKIIFMNSFLYRVAKAYYHQYDTDILNYTFVFPNRRAGLFFQTYLQFLLFGAKHHYLLQRQRYSMAQ